MGEIIGAGIVSHVPTIMLPEPIRIDMGNGEDTSIVAGMHRLRDEVLDALQADTFIVFDTHWGTTFEFVVTAHERRNGKYTSEELPRGMCQVPYDLKGDPELARGIGQAVTSLGIACTPIDDPYLPIHYPTVNLAHYLNRGERWLSIGMCQTAQTEDYLCVGQGIADAIAASGRRVALLASGSMSHRFHSLKDLSQHESWDPAHIFSAEARAADLERLDWFAEGDHARVIDTMDDFYTYKPEGRFGHYLMMVAALGGRNCRATGRLLSKYENAVGTSQVHVWFDRPQAGWTGDAVEKVAPGP